VMPKISAHFWHQWSSFSFSPMNWRDFTFVNVSVEVAAYANRYFELTLVLLGFGVIVEIHGRKQSSPDAAGGEA
jgi:hypothetical protein